METKLKFMTEETAKNYKNALCVLNRDKIRIWGNWFENDFNTLVVTVEECMNTTYNNNKCAPPEEIQEYIETHSFFFNYQKTIVDRGIYHEDAQEAGLFNSHSYETYFPLVNTMVKYHRGPLIYKRDKYNLFNEFSLGLDEIAIDDNLFQTAESERHATFVNI